MVLTVVAFHLGTRVLAWSALVVAAATTDKSFGAVVTSWDGKWYGRIVTGGYPNPLPMNAAGQVVTNPAAFFPLFPYLLKPLVLGGVPYWLAVTLLVPVFSTVAALAIAATVRLYSNERVGVLTACCWSAFPSAGVLSVAYTEGLFTMLAAACLYALLRHRWLLAGILAALAGASRPTGVVVVAAVGVAVLEALIRRREWRSLVALVIAPIGTLLALGMIAVQTGRWDAWFITEREGWRMHFDGGLSLARWTIQSIAAGNEPLRLAFVGAVLLVIALTVVAVVQRAPLPVLTYLVLGIVLAVGQGGEMFLSPIRYALPIFPFLVPVAAWLTGRRSPLVWLLLGAAALASAAVTFYYFALSPGAP